MKKSSKIILIIVIILLIAVIGVETYFIIKNHSDSNKKIENLEKQIEDLSSKNTDKENVDKNSNEKTDNEEKDDSKNKVSDDSEEYYETAKNAIKKALKDENWKKENLYMSEEDNPNIDDADEYENDCRFVVCKKGDTPVVVIEVASEEARYRKIVLITYKNGKVKVEPISSVHIYHGDYAVDSEKSVVVGGYMHMGYIATTVYSVKDNKVEFKGGYETEDGWDEETEEEKYSYYIYGKTLQDRQNVSEEAYDKQVKKLNVDQYNLENPEIELNNENIDKYIK